MGMLTRRIRAIEKKSALTRKNMKPMTWADFMILSEREEAGDEAAARELRFRCDNDHRWQAFIAHLIESDDRGEDCDDAGFLISGDPR